jgi:hypothetical protein
MCSRSAVTSPNSASSGGRRPRPVGEQFDESTVEVFGQGAVLLYHRVAQDQRIIQVVQLLWLG